MSIGRANTTRHYFMHFTPCTTPKYIHTQYIFCTSTLFNIIIQLNIIEPSCSHYSNHNNNDKNSNKISNMAILSTPSSGNCSAHSIVCFVQMSGVGLFTAQWGMPHCQCRKYARRFALLAVTDKVGMPPCHSQYAQNSYILSK